MISRSAALHLLVVEHRIGVDAGGDRHVPVEQQSTHAASTVRELITAETAGTDKIGEIKRIAQCDTLILGDGTHDDPAVDGLVEAAARASGL